MSKTAELFLRWLAAYRFPLSEVATACGIDAGTIRNWMERAEALCVPAESADQFRGGRGTRSTFSLRRALHIVLMARLTQIGLTPRDASLAALRATDGGASPYVSLIDAALHGRVTDLALLILPNEVHVVEAADIPSILRDAPAVVIVRLDAVFGSALRTLGVAPIKAGAPGTAA